MSLAVIRFAFLCTLLLSVSNPALAEEKGPLRRVRLPEVSRERSSAGRSAPLSGLE